MPNPLKTSEARIQDAALQITTALPAADAAAAGNSLDLVAAGIASLRLIEVEVAVPALPALAEAKDLTITLQDSADDSSFAAISEIAEFTVTGGTGGGAAATSFKVRLPSSTRQYIRANYAVEDDGGDNTGVSATLKILN